MAERNRTANRFNKIGLHVDSDPEFEARRIYDWVSQLNEAGIPVFLKTVDNYSPIKEALDWVLGSEVRHTFVYRMSSEGVGNGRKSTWNNLEEPDYNRPPKEAAARHWQAILSYLPSEFDPERVWLEVLHEPDESYTDWLGMFAVEISRIALEQNFRLAHFGWGSRQPSREAWYQGSMAEFLHLCQERPDHLAISLHEFSQNPYELFNTPDSGIGHFQELFAACADKAIDRPTVFISEWGWSKEEIPDPEQALAHLQQAGELYAQFPEIRGAALWTLGGQQRTRLSESVDQLIEPLTRFTLNVQFEEAGDTAVPLTKGSDNYGQTAVVSENTDPYEVTARPIQPAIPDYDARFLNHVTIADGTAIPPQRLIEKIWRVKNSGRLPWNEHFSVVQQDNTPLGPRLSFPLIFAEEGKSPIHEIEPEKLADVRIEIESPAQPGQYQAAWRLQNDEGEFFGDALPMVLQVTPEGDTDVGAVGEKVQVINLDQLRRGIRDAFNLDELQMLAFDLNINYDDLPGSNLASKSRELVSLLVREQRIGELYTSLLRLRPALDWPPLIEVNPAALARQLNASFNLEELKDLCFTLRIAFDDLPGDTKSEKTIGLIQHLQRRNRLYELIDQIKDERPNLLIGEPFVEGGLSPADDLNAQFVADVTIPDDSRMPPGTSFVKTWRVLNNGRLPWQDGFTIGFTNGLQMGKQEVYPLPPTQPGETVEISVEMRAPDQPGTHFSDWRLRDDQGNAFGDTLFARILVPEPEPSPHEPAVWFYIGSGDDPQQMDLLAKADEVTWAANKNSRRGDLILMYRDGRYQDFAYFFQALDDAREQDPASAPPGWDKKWSHAIQLGQKQPLANPVSRHLLKTHPDLRDWRPISHSPQGIMNRRLGLNREEGGEPRWQAMRGIIAGWNPTAAVFLAGWESLTEKEILEGALTAVSALPDPKVRREGLLTLSRHLGTRSEFTDLLESLSQDADWQVKTEALRQLGRKEPDAQDILREAAVLINHKQYRHTINFLEKEAPGWQSSDSQASQAQAHRLLGEAYQGLGQKQPALSHFQQAARLDPDDVTTFDKIGRLTPPEQLEEAEKFITDVGRKATKSAGPAVGLAAIAEQKGDLETAISQIKKARDNATPDQEQKLDDLARRLAQYINQPVTTPVLEPLSTDPVLLARQNKLINVLRETFDKSQIEDLCVRLGVVYEDLSGDRRSDKARGLVLEMTRRNRLPELIDQLRQLRPERDYLFRETAVDLFADAREKLRLNQPQAAIDLLQSKSGLWQMEPNKRTRARGHALLAQAYEATQQKTLAFGQWKLKAPLALEEIDAFLGLVRTAADEELENLSQWLETMRQRRPTAVGPITGLAALLSRQNKPEEAVQLLAKTRTGNLTQDKLLDRTAKAIHQDPDTALEALGKTAVPAPAGIIPTDSNRLTEAMSDLAAAQSPLDANDQESVFREIVQRILGLATLSPAHKREFRRRANRVLADVRRSGQFTPQHAADLRLPVLDSLFITDPVRRRALVHAAAAYRQQPTRRLNLYLRSRARRQIRDQLSSEKIRTLLAADGETRQQAFAELQTAVWQTGTVNNTPLKTWLANHQADGRALRDWRQAQLTITGNLCHDLPARLLAFFPDDSPALWQAVFDLCHNDDAAYQRKSAWDRRRLSGLDDQMSSLILWAFEPEEHLPFQPETVAAALAGLELSDQVNFLDYPGFVTFARLLLQDDDLGFASLDDAACFLSQIAVEENHTVSFSPGDEPADYASLLPQLADSLLMPVNAFDTSLTLSNSTFSQMAHALSAGNHIILIGPPGTGKTTIAQDVCALAQDLSASRGVISVTATADWTTFDTVGGYMPNDDGRLVFREGILLRAIREQKWVIIDEINRAEIDKAFGELFTVLSGQAITLPYRDGGAPIRIVPADFPGKSTRDYVIPPGWRIIGTMNVFDKASLFEMSSAFMRRFAFVDVGIPRPNAVFMELIDRWLAEFNLATEPENEIATALKTHIFAADSDIMKHRQLGPAIARDMIRYIGQCQKQGEAVSLQHVGEAFLLYAIPQFDGLDEPTVITVHKHLQATFANTDTLNEIHRRMQDLFPQYDLVEAAPVPEPVAEPAAEETA